MKRALLLATLILLPLLPTAESAGAEPRPWSPYNAGVEVSSVALAREGTTIIAGVRAPPPPNPTGGGIPVLPTPNPDPSQPVPQRLDAAILDIEYGFARAETVAAIAPDGTTYVAVSRDGRAVATLHREVVVTGQTQQSHLRLHYARIAGDGNWSAGPAFQRNLSLGAVDVAFPVGVAVSDDGNRVAVLTGEAGNFALRGWSSGGSSLDSAFEIRQPGTPRALAASGDLSRMVVVGQFPRPVNMTYGGGLVFQFAQADAYGSYFDTSQNNTDMRGAAISRDGSTVALGGATGQLVLFHGARDSIANPQVLALGSGSLGNVTMSEDGRRFAGAIGNNVAVVNIEGAPTTIWNATVGGQNVTSLAMDRLGALLIVGSTGTGGGVLAYSDVDPTLLWSVPGDTRGVAIDSAGTRVAYAQRTGVGGVRLPRALAMDLTTGGKVAPTQTVTVPGSASVTVNLRNDGTGLERVVFEESSPDVNVTSDQAITNVKPGAIVRVNLTINVNAGLVSQRVFNVTARSITSGLVDNVTLSVVPRPTLDVKLSVNTTDILAQAGTPSEFLVTITNNGTGDAPVALSATQSVSGGPQWNLSLSETQLTALRGTRTSVKVTVTPPASASNGTASTITLTLQGQNVFDSKTVTLRINPELKVEVSGTGVTKLIEPGKRAYYNVTVTNIGTLPRDFDVFYTITQSSNRNWGVDMPSQVVRLEPGKNRTFAVTIVAPADALPQENVRVLITARSIPEVQNETIVEDNLTLSGIAVEPKVTTTTTPSNGIPFLAPLAAVACAVLIAAFLPRRRRQ